MNKGTELSQLAEHVHNLQIINIDQDAKRKQMYQDNQPIQAVDLEVLLNQEGVKLDKDY